MNSRRNSSHLRLTRFLNVDSRTVFEIVSLVFFSVSIFGCVNVITSVELKNEMYRSKYIMKIILCVQTNIFPGWFFVVVLVVFIDIFVIAVTSVLMDNREDRIGLDYRLQNPKSGQTIYALTHFCSNAFRYYYFCNFITARRLHWTFWSWV